MPIGEVGVCRFGEVRRGDFYRDPCRNRESIEIIDTLDNAESGFNSSQGVRGRQSTFRENANHADGGRVVAHSLGHRIAIILAPVYLSAQVPNRLPPRHELDGIR